MNKQIYFRGIDDLYFGKGLFFFKRNGSWILLKARISKYKWKIIKLLTVKAIKLKKAIKRKYIITSKAIIGRAKKFPFRFLMMEKTRF